MANPSTNADTATGYEQPGAGSAIGEHPKPVFSGEWVAFALSDQIALSELIRRVARAGSRMAEVGSWLGNGSTQVFLRELEPFRDAEVFCIDTWQGSSNVQRHLDFIARYDAYATFLHNVAQAGRRTKLTPIRASSVAAADTFADRSLDFVFIDADHSYEAAKADIAAWRSKVKPGGFFAVTTASCALPPTIVLSCWLTSPATAAKFPERRFGMFIRELCWPSTKPLAERLNCGPKQH